MPSLLLMEGRYLGVVQTARSIYIRTSRLGDLEADIISRAKADASGVGSRPLSEPIGKDLRTLRPAAIIPCVWR